MEDEDQNMHSQRQIDIADIKLEGSDSANMRHENVSILDNSEKSND